MLSSPAFTAPLPVRIRRALLWAALLLFGLHTTVASARYEQALSVEADTPVFPENLPTRMVSLPDEWSHSYPRSDGPVWYRIRFDAMDVGSGNELLGVFIERACSNVEIHLNGHRVGGAGRMTEPLTRNCYEPHSAALSPGLLKPQGNVLDIKLAGYPLDQVASRQRAAGLSAVDIGPADDIARHLRADRFQRVVLPQIVAGALLMLGLVVLLLGSLQRTNPHLSWFGALCLAWTAMSARSWITLAVPNDLAELFIATTVPLAAMCAIQFLLRHARWQHRIIDVALWVQCLMVPASLALAGAPRTYEVATAWYSTLATETVMGIAWYLLRVWRRRHPDFWLLLGVVATAASLVAMEFAAQRGFLSPDLLHFSPYLMPLVLTLMGALLLYEYARILQGAESIHDTLDQRVRDATADLERNYNQMADMRVEQVTQQERKRIAADLHDDLGAKLLTIVHTSDNDRISTLAREALEEMRLSVRGLTGKPVQLADALGDWRAEVVSRLSQAGVEGEWHAPTEELTQTLSARAYVQTTRILRESVSNIIKHSGASHCSVTCRLADGDFQVVIQDNGNGIPMELDGKLDRGHGMSSMKHRAKQLHGQCLVESGPGYGTVIRLTLPL